jgi:cation transport ATPase
LTGESLPVTIKEGENIRSGGIIRRGQADAVVAKTGIHTYIGEAVDLVAQQKPHVSNLQKVLIKLSRVHRCTLHLLLAAVP